MIFYWHRYNSDRLYLQSIDDQSNIAKIEKVIHTSELYTISLFKELLNFKNIKYTLDDVRQYFSLKILAQQYIQSSIITPIKILNDKQTNLL